MKPSIQSALLLITIKVSGFLEQLYTWDSGILWDTPGIYWDQGSTKMAPSISTFNKNPTIGITGGGALS